MNRCTKIGPNPIRARTLVIQPLPGIGDMRWHLPRIQAIARAGPPGGVALLTKRRSQYALACRLAGIGRRVGYGRGWQGLSYPPLTYSPFLSAITPRLPRSGMAGIGVEQVLEHVLSVHRP